MEVLVVFVTSRRLWARVSRVLVVLMLGVLVAGAVIYYKKSPAPVAAGEAQKPATATPGSNQPAPSASGQGPMSASPANSSGAPVVLPPLEPIAAGPSPALPPAIPSPAPAPAAAPAEPLTVADAEKLVADAKSKVEAGDLVTARNLLNPAIVGDRLPATFAEAARAWQARANEKLIFSPQSFPGDTYSTVSRVEKSDSLRQIARQNGVPWEFVCRVNGTTDTRIRIGQRLKAPVGPVHVVVTKSAFRMDLYLRGLPGEEGSLYVTSLPVGLGKDDSTPTGVWEVVSGGKMKNPHWTNPRSGQRYEGYDPKNPLGGYWIALKGTEGNAVGQTGYGIHGTIEPESIGKQASMGCIRLTVDDVKQVYDMLTEKSRVLVKE